nr:MAG TPA: hypothetical protein [Caudoviricetes sp.]
MPIVGNPLVSGGFFFICGFLSRTSRTPQQSASGLVRLFRLRCQSAPARSAAAQSGFLPDRLLKVSFFRRLCELRPSFFYFPNPSF